MAETDPKKFYVTIKRKSEQQNDYESCTISIDHPNDAKEEKVQDSAPEKVAEKSNEQTDFKAVLKTFRDAMDGYRNFIPLTLWAAPHLAYQMGFNALESAAEHKGVKLTGNSTGKSASYELDIEHYAECMLIQEKMEISVDRAKHLPEVMLIGLVSVYDAMLGRLLKVVFNKHEEIVLTSDKTIKFSDLSAFGSIDAAKAALIDKEIESVLRESHHDQFAWMERKFAIKLREDLAIWPTFVEVCERRNLITHTGGIVSAQYLKSGQENKFDVSSVVLGDKLKVDGAYYTKAVNAVYEIGVKLCHVFWRRFSEKERESADDALNQLGFKLIVDRNYDLAEAVLRFAVGLKKHHSDKIRRMMVVNLANAVRLQKREADAKAILKSEDWSAVGDDFKLCVAAIEGDEERLIELMTSMGASGLVTVEDYRNWPVFRGWRTKEKFATTFEAIFGSKLLVPKKAEVETIEPPKESEGQIPPLGSNVIKLVSSSDESQK